jgi:hypothetical protein
MYRSVLGSQRINLLPVRIDWKFLTSMLYVKIFEYMFLFIIGCIRSRLFDKFCDFEVTGINYFKI